VTELSKESRASLSSWPRNEGRSKIVVNRLLRINQKEMVDAVTELDALILVWSRYVLTKWAIVGVAGTTATEEVKSFP